MKRLHKRQRIFILSLLCFSVFAPIDFVSYRLKALSLEGNKEFVEDLASIKYKADTLRLSAIQQEEEGVKEPKEEVYRDQRFSITRHSSNEISDAKSINTTSLGRKGGTDHTFQEENVQTQPKKEEVVSTTGKQSEVGTSRQDEKAIPSPAIRCQSNRDLQTQKRREVDGKVKEMKDQLIRAKAYLSFATPAGNTHLVKELKLPTKEVERALGDARKDSDLSRTAYSRMRHMETTLAKANRVYPDCSAMVKKLRAMTQSAEEKVWAQRNQTALHTSV